MMRKRIWTGAAIGLLAVALAATAWAGHETYQGFQVVHVVVNGQPLATDVPAVNFYGRTMLPVRAVAEALGAEVGWDAATSTAILTTTSPAAAQLPKPPITLEGQGQAATQLVRLESGLHVVRSAHGGEGHFAVVPYTAAGKRLSVLANVIGHFDGSAVLTLSEPTDVLFQVSADGRWTISIEPPR